MPIPGTKQIKYLEENAGAAEIALTKNEIERISRAVPPDGVAGLRYPADRMKNLNR